ncbi:hypothetical protein AQUCO_02700260v1 [Aquilegia coerulea]|uniref:PsbP C-terminal domain-containing protein n=1 Tax=Aquilegia coerulea TaxID=218851 RepID=A0A2G5D634_AQUCA|nr:hypothetical protein AQUCO_02700260v1 [Aquilegia coerulea]
MAAASPISLSWASTLPKQLIEKSSTITPTFPTFSINACLRQTSLNEQACSRRRQILLGVGALATSWIPASFVSAEVPANYRAFVDSEDGYSYYYPSDWRDFDYLGHDSAFKDRYLALQNVRVSFIPTTKTDIHELGPMEEVIYNLVTHKFSAPTQKATIFDMQERNVDGKNYYTFEYDLTSTNFSRTAFATVAIANGRYYTLIVGANERRWRRVRDQLKVVADSFKVLDI